MDKHLMAVGAFLGSALAGGVLAFVGYALWGGPCTAGGVSYGQCVFGMSVGDAATRLGAIGAVLGVVIGVAIESGD